MTPQTAGGARVISIEDRAARAGITILNWDRTGISLHCDRCGHVFGCGFAGGDIAKPAPVNSWWKCEHGCNSSSRDPMKQPLPYEGGKPSSIFDDVIRRK